MQLLNPLSLHVLVPLITLLAISLLPCALCTASVKAGYVALCTSSLSDPDLFEWIEYHRFLGVDHIYVYEPHGFNVTTKTKELIQPFIEEGFVDFNIFSAPRNLHQRYVYDDCLLRSRGRYHWVALFDSDEYLYVTPLLNHNLPALLKQYESYGGLAVNWLAFGSSGHKTRPVGGVLRNYVKCFPRQAQTNTHVKVIANVHHTVRMSHTPHTFIFAPGFFAVDELQRRVDGPFTVTATHKLVQLHHYAVRSVEDFKRKNLIGSGMGNHKEQPFFDGTDAGATQNCYQGVRMSLVCCPLTRAMYGLPEGLGDLAGVNMTDSEQMVVASHLRRLRGWPTWH